MKLLFLTFLLVTLAICMISVVTAADITISPITPGGLKKAVESAENGDTIYLKNGVYSGENNREINIIKSVNIIGKGKNVVIDGERQSYFFTSRIYYNVSLESLTLINFGYNKMMSGGAISAGPLTVKDCTFTNNQAGTGGAITCLRALTVSKSTFKNNKATNSAGAIRCYGALTVSSCTFKNNQAPYGGAILCHRALTLSKSTFKNNQAGIGGAIFKWGPSTVSSCTFKNNQARYRGGAIYNKNGALTVKNTNFTKNIENKKYNAIYGHKDKITKKNVTITPKDGTKVKK